MKHLRKLEETLSQKEIRANLDELNTLIHEEFIEIGYSGTTYTKPNILTLLLNENTPDTESYSQEFQYINLSADTILLLYQSARINQNGQLKRHAKRTSIWFNNEGNWQLKFHQGTPTEPFEKLNT